MLVAVDGVTVHISLKVRAHPDMALIAQRFNATKALYGRTQLRDAELLFVETETDGEMKATVRTREPGESEPQDWEHFGSIDFGPPN